MKYILPLDPKLEPAFLRTSFFAALISFRQPDEIDSSCHRCFLLTMSYADRKVQSPCFLAAVGFEPGKVRAM